MATAPLRKCMSVVAGMPVIDSPTALVRISLPSSSHPHDDGQQVRLLHRVVDDPFDRARPLVAGSGSRHPRRWRYRRTTGEDKAHARERAKQSTEVHSQSLAAESQMRTRYRFWVGVFTNYGCCE